MRTIPSVFALISVAVPLSAFPQATTPRISTSTSTLPSGAVQLKIENNADQAITAYAYTASFVSAGKQVTGERFYDSSIFLGQRPILPHQTHIEQQGGPGITDVQYTFKAAIFADGTTFGAPEWAQRIVSRRQIAGQVLGRIQQLLAAQTGSGTPADALISQMNAYLASRMAATSDPDQRETEQRFTRVVIQNLRQLSQGGKAPDEVLSKMLDVIQKAQTRLQTGQ